MKNEVLRLERVTQIEDGVTLLDNFSLHIFEGEIMGLCCLNAHGKEPLIRLLCQNVPIHYGYVYLQERLVNNYVHSSMSQNRVSVIERRSRLAGHLTVADNIFVLRRGFKKYIINPQVLEAQLRQFTEGLGVEIDGREPAQRLTGYERCVVELLRAVVSGTRLVVLRDISNFLGEADLMRFHGLLRRYAAQGMSFLYICNHHEEAFGICDRIALTEDGRVHKVFDKPDFRDETLLHFANVRGFEDGMPFVHLEQADTGVLDFREVRGGSLQGLSFTVGQGECVVLLDMDNSALPSIQRMMEDAVPPEAGKILVDGLPWPREARRLRRELCFIGENPMQSALFPEMNYIDNLCSWLERRQPLLWCRPHIQKSIIQEYEPLVGEDIYATDINGMSPHALYNLVYYKVHLCRPKVLFLSQPFSGADLYLRRQIIDLITVLKKRGIAVVILAVSISDSLRVADRLLAIEDGRLKREYASGEFHSYRAGKT